MVDVGDGGPEMATPPAHGPSGWQVLMGVTVIIGVGFTAGTFFLSVLSPRDFITRNEYIADDKRVDETTIRLDRRLEEIQKQMDGFGMMRVQIQDLWSKFYPDARDDRVLRKSESK